MSGKNTRQLIKINQFFFIILTLTAFVSCSSNRYIYSASPSDSPYFIKKGESKIAAYYSSAGGHSLTQKYANGYDVEGAYAIGSHWAISASIFHRGEKDIYSNNGFAATFANSLVMYKRNMAEAGLGYFTSINSKNTVSFNFYGGVARGKFSIDDNGTNNNMAAYTRSHNANVIKWYLQPSFNFMPAANFHFALILKTSFVRYKNIQTDYTAGELQSFNLDRIDNRTFSFIEPAFNFQFGLPAYPWVKLDLTISGISNYAANTQNIRRSNASIGISFDLSKMHDPK